MMRGALRKMVDDRVEIDFRNPGAFGMYVRHFLIREIR